MKCPRCDREMSEGTAVIRGSFLGFLLVGFSWMKLVFTDARTSRATAVMYPHQERGAHRCSRCGSLFIMGIPADVDPSDAAADEETVCLDCGKPIPAEQDRCPACGWSYEKS